MSIGITDNSVRFTTATAWRPASAGSAAGSSNTPVDTMARPRTTALQTPASPPSSRSVLRTSWAVGSALTLLVSAFAMPSTPALAAPLHHAGTVQKVHSNASKNGFYVNEYGETIHNGSNIQKGCEGPYGCLGPGQPYVPRMSETLPASVHIP